MNNCIIIDSNKAFAENLYESLTGVHNTENIFDTRDQTLKDLGRLSEEVVSKITKENRTTSLLLINAEAEMKDGFLEIQPVVELIFWMRCKHEFTGPIIIYSCQALSRSLKTNPENLILVSPGCYYLDIRQLLAKIDKISQFKPLLSLEEIKPYLKPAINLGFLRHRYANFAGMAIMQLVAKAKHDIKFDSDILIEERDYNYSKLKEFINSISYRILKFYFNLRVSNLKTYCNSNPSPRYSKKILLIDDLANEGWLPILSQVIYGDPRADDLLISASIKVTDGKFDKDATIIELDKMIISHKPDLILLDLRLNDEEGKKLLPKFGGYQLLKYIKTNPKYKGVPVIMFTASSNAQTVKNLIANGAYCVWTKPGIDEGLSAYECVKRYEQLLSLIDTIVNPENALLDLVNDNKEETFDINHIDFEALKIEIFRKLDFIKYRLQLYSDAEIKNKIPYPYNIADAIYFDTNALITGIPWLKYAEIISSICKCSILTAQSKFRHLRSARLKNKTFPKTVIMNSVFDEVIKKAKKEGYKKETNRDGSLKNNNLVYKRASISQLIIKDLFDSGFVRTEVDKYLSCKLENPKENVYADGYILDEVAELLVTNDKVDSKYEMDTKIIFVSGDENLRKKLTKFNKNTDTTLFIRTLEEFRTDMSKIPI